MVIVINFKAEKLNKIGSETQNIDNYSIQTSQNVKNNFEKSPAQDEFDNGKKTKKILV